jgi:hypothetical protein
VTWLSVKELFGLKFILSQNPIVHQLSTKMLPNLSNCTPPVKAGLGLAEHSPYSQAIPLYFKHEEPHFYYRV